MDFIGILVKEKLIICSGRAGSSPPVYATQRDRRARRRNHVRTLQPYDPRHHRPKAREETRRRDVLLARRPRRIQASTKERMKLTNERIFECNERVYDCMNE